MILARWTQPSGPLCLWQCLFYIPFVCIFFKILNLLHPIYVYFTPCVCVLCIDFTSNLCFITPYVFYTSSVCVFFTPHMTDFLLHRCFLTPYPIWLFSTTSLCYFCHPSVLLFFVTLHLRLSLWHSICVYFHTPIVFSLGYPTGWAESISGIGLCPSWIRRWSIYLLVGFTDPNNHTCSENLWWKPFKNHKRDNTNTKKMTNTTKKTKTQTKHL